MPGSHYWHAGMSFINLYIGDAEDPKFQWEGGSYTANIPKILVEFPIITFRGWSKAIDLLKNLYGGKTLDWGASGALMNKANIAACLALLDEGDWWVKASLEKLKVLEDGKIYVLFACESG